MRLLILIIPVVSRPKLSTLAAPRIYVRFWGPKFFKVPFLRFDPRISIFPGFWTLFGLFFGVKNASVSVYQLLLFEIIVLNP